MRRTKHNPNLAVFDIDGTLTDSVTTHQNALLETFQVHGLAQLHESWSAYKHHTDSWVFREAFEMNHGVLPNGEDAVRFVQTFDQLFAQKASESPIRPLAGAKALVDHLVETEDWAVAFATGSFRAASVTKLIQASIWFEEDLLSTASEALTRPEIVGSAVRRAGRHYDCAAFARIVCVGDGVWDFETAMEMGFDFVGVGEGEKASELIDLGAHVFPNLSEAKAVLGRSAS